MLPENPVFVAFDTADLAQAIAWADAVRPSVGGIKLGLEFFNANGPDGVRRIVDLGLPVFLDLKFHDIPNTVASAVSSATGLGVGMLTVHTGGGSAMLRAACDAAGEAAARIGCQRPLVIGVTVLTSLSSAELKEVGVEVGRAEEQVARLVDVALAAGLDGVVASPREAALVRERAGDALRVVTPGVRPADAPADDQTRTATAADAVREGADVVVVARPVIRAPDPAEAARGLVREIEAGLAARRT
jgi:orotidine-5'-phosphate decarboxylase